MPFGAGGIEPWCTINCSASARLLSNTDLHLIFGKVKQQIFKIYYNFTHCCRLMAANKAEERTCWCHMHPQWWLFTNITAVLLINSLGKLKKRFVQGCARIVLDFNFSSVEKVSAQRLYLENLLGLKSAAPTLGQTSMTSYEHVTGNDVAEG